jgi:hypothetical protein
MNIRQKLILGYKQGRAWSATNHPTNRPTDRPTYTGQSPSWGANSSSASKEIPTFCGTRRLATKFKSTHDLSRSWARSIQSVASHPPSFKIDLNIFFQSTLASTKWSVSARSCHHNPVCTSLLSYTGLMRHQIPFVIWLPEWYLVSADYTALHYVVFSSTLLLLPS